MKLLSNEAKRNKMTDPKEIRATLLKTAADFIQCYNKWTIEAVLSLRTDTCKQTVRPASLGVPTFAKADYGTFVGPFMALLSDCKFEIVDDNETVVDVEKRKVVIHVQASASSPVGEYKNEYQWTLTMTEDGKMIEDILEFTDSATAVDFFRKQAQMDV